ncbi:GAF domain-containing SpoIIE family protein phosphatase [Haliovirga abyssi]|uniref:PPM-type phosphatase domain-containing protein n=1 Tax=Haliovirga abyssi TaxID=2996794 RepID=A0AAU9D6L6_9FUSO|nr:GAF domain-containing SpoIIE family protein phosphatase [Haliovirga abyssi]BDU50193.1 hypothetical protein HLVA_07620 [Haliovirga abyssi]
MTILKKKLLNFSGLVVLFLLFPILFIKLANLQNKFITFYLFFLIFETITYGFIYILFEVRIRGSYYGILKYFKKINKKFDKKIEMNSLYMMAPLKNIEYIINIEIENLNEKIDDLQKKLEDIKVGGETKFRLKEYQLKGVVSELENMNDMLLKKETYLDDFLKIIKELDRKDLDYDLFFEELLFYLISYLKIKDIAILQKLKKGIKVYSNFYSEAKFDDEMIKRLDQIEDIMIMDKNVNKSLGYNLIIRLKKHGYIFINNFPIKDFKHSLLHTIFITIIYEITNIADNLQHIKKLSGDNLNQKKEISKLKNELQEVENSLEVQLEQITDMYEEIVTLYEAGKSFGKLLNKESAEKITLEMLLEILECEYGAVFWYNKNSLSVSNILVNSEYDEDNREMEKEIKKFSKLFRGFVELKRKGSEIVVDDVKNSIYKDDIKDLEFRVKNFIITPLYHGKDIIGGVAIFNKKDSYTAGNINLTISITNQLGMSVQNIAFLENEIDRKKEEEQLVIASRIQAGLFPTEMPKIPYFEVYGENHPAKAVGGDYFDFVKVSDDLMVGIIADVSGKGIPAALLVSMIRTIFRMVVENIKIYDPSKILEYINDTISKEELDGRFVTAIGFSINSKTKKIKFANAGHDPILYYDSKEKEIMEYDLDGPVLGFMEGMEFEELERDLRKGDVALLYTDGVLEARNDKKEFFEDKRLKDTLDAVKKYPVSYIVRTIHKNVVKFLNGSFQNDDITILTIKGVDKN